MRDLKQTSYWDGASWNDLRNSAPVFAGGFFLEVGLNPGSTANFGLLTFTTPRPCALSIWEVATYLSEANVWQNVAQAITFDGTPSMLGGFQEQVRFSGDPFDSGNHVYGHGTSITVIPSVSAGQHQIGIRTQVDHDYWSSVILYGVKIIAMISTFASGNSL